MLHIFEERVMFVAPLKCATTLSQDHPCKRQCTIAHTQPDETTNEQMFQVYDSNEFSNIYLT